MIILRVIWFLAGVGFTLTALFYFGMEVGYMLTLCDEPKPNILFMLLAYSGTALFSAQADAEYFAKHLRSPQGSEEANG